MKSFTNHLNIFRKSLLALALGAILPVAANEIPVGDKENSFMDMTVENIYQTDNGKLAVELGLNLNRVNIKSQFEQIFTPYLYNGPDTITFDSFAITGHKRLLSNQRNNTLIPITFYKNQLVETNLLHPNTDVATKYPANGNFELIMTTNWKDWMENATFSIDNEIRGCANCLKNIDGVGEELIPLAQTEYLPPAVNEFMPEFLFVTPVAEAVKTREISARAYIDFPVNRTEIYPDYRRNPQELAKIRATIDSVRSDKDITITKLHISGTASPEGSYQNNVRLAKGRTESLKNYVQSLYRFPYGFITTSYEPVDWQGLAEFLIMVDKLKYTGFGNGRGFKPNETVNPQFPADSIRFDQFQNINFDPATINSILPDADKILAIVDSNIEPFERNNKIKFGYKDQYAWLLENVYPALRHSDYRIEFEIKQFTEVAEILQVMQDSPQKLSLSELFVAANSQAPGSLLYNRAFELAAAMYPNDETANINAATNAMANGDLNMAQYFLTKAGNSPAADYGRAMLTLLQGDRDRAIAMFSVLASSPNPEVALKATAAKAGLEYVPEKPSGFNFKLVE